MDLLPERNSPGGVCVVSCHPMTQQVSEWIQSRPDIWIRGETDYAWYPDSGAKAHAGHLTNCIIGAGCYGTLRSDGPSE